MRVLVEQRRPKHLGVRVANEAGVDDDDRAKEAEGVDRLRGLADDDDSQGAEVSVVSDDVVQASNKLVVTPELMEHHLGTLPPEPNPNRRRDPTISSPSSKSVSVQVVAST